MAPKYFLALLPLIIIWLSLKITKVKKKSFYSLILICSILNSIYYWHDTPIKRPPLRELLNIVSSQNIKKIYSTESTVFNNYLSHYKLAIVNNIKIEKFKDIKQNTNENKVAFVCMNYPRASYGVSYTNLVQNKCKDLSISLENNIKRNTIIELEKIKIPDFIIFIVKYKS
tara:strand:- start:250 stop:762 length:513 start_codon:yes stop_codon:yes gene_type:complete